jgi:NTE family protein
MALALQGAGAHGAFIWGVLDRLLEEDRLHIDAVSASSAGALNAACVAHGMANGGADAARRTLESFWECIADVGSLESERTAWFERVARDWGLQWSPAFIGYDPASGPLNPYEFNPLNLDPVREVLSATVDFEELQSPLAPVRLFLTATNVRTGQPKVFRQCELTADAVLASACSPFLFQPIEIGGEHYWDGGSMGSPAILPLIRGSDARDIVLVHTRPARRVELPRTVRQIASRTREIGFNASVMHEMRTVELVSQIMESRGIAHPLLRPPLWHAIVAEDPMSAGLMRGHRRADRALLVSLREHGRMCAGLWLRAHFDALGRRSTIEMPNSDLEMRNAA